MPAHDALTIGSWQTPIVTRAGAFDPSRASCPFAPFRHLTAELASSEGRDDKPSLGERGIRLGVAGAAEGDEAVEVEVRSALSTLEDVMHLEARAQATSLADPAGAGQDLCANVLELFEACGGASQR